MSAIRAKKLFVVAWAVASTLFFYIIISVSSEDTWDYLVGYVPSLPFSLMLQPLAAFLGGAGGEVGSLIASTVVLLFAGACTGSALAVVTTWWSKRRRDRQG